MNQYKKRQSQITALMKQKSIKALILSPSVNMSYVTGFTTFPGERILISILTDEGQMTFIAPKLYEEEVKAHGTLDSILAWDDSQNPSELIQKAADIMGLHDCTIAIEDTMYFSAFNRIMQTLRGITYTQASEIVGDLRIIKSKEEIDKMRNASHLADKALSQVVPKIKAGMKETEVKDMLEAEMKKLGFASPSFDTIIGSGPMSALPHYSAGERILQEGEAVVVDFGGVLEDYCSDMTRTFFIGKATEEYKKVYNILKEAQQKAIDTVKPGAKARDIDFAARSHITQNGYGEYFIHRTGHGAGLEVHETPYITDSSELTLRPGMIFSIEPGIYLPDKFGIRIEDLVVVTEDGLEVLNTFSKEMMTL